MLRYLNRCARTKQVATHRRPLVFTVLLIVQGCVQILNESVARVRYCHMRSCMLAVNYVQYHLLTLNTFLTIQNGSCCFFRVALRSVCGQENSGRPRCVSATRPLRKSLEIYLYLSNNPTINTINTISFTETICRSVKSSPFVINEYKSSYKKASFHIYQFSF